MSSQTCSYLTISINIKLVAQVSRVKSTADFFMNLTDN
jgi:hypothetical protein